MARGPESKIQDWAISYLRRNLPGIYVRKIHQSMYSHKGIPDLLGGYGLFFAIEVKTEKGVPTKLQKIELQKIREAHNIGVIMYGKNKPLLDALIKRLEEHVSPL